MIESNSPESDKLDEWILSINREMGLDAPPTLPNGRNYPKTYITNVPRETSPINTDRQRLPIPEYTIGGGSSGCLWNNLSERDKMKPLLLSCPCPKCSPQC